MRTLPRVMSGVLLASALLLLSPTPWAQGSVSQAIVDGAVTSKVKTALMANEQTKATEIDVETQNGVVQLSGFVETEAAKQEAVRTARQVSGVRDVQNKLLLRDTTRSTGQAVDDTVIAAKLKTELAGKAGLGTATDVNVEVNAGVVELSGFVPTQAQKMKAAEIARGINGVRNVENNIELKPKS